MRRPKMATTQERIAAPAAAAPAVGANNMKWLGVGIAIVLGLVILMMPQPAGLTPAGQRVLAITAFTVVLWVFQVVNNGIVAILMMALMMVGGIRPPDALSGFSNPLWCILAAVLFFGCGIKKRGITNRISNNTLP